MTNCCVIGLGYIGLPTAAILAETGHSVFGFDIDKSIVELLNKGKIHIKEPSLEKLVEKVIANKLFMASTSPSEAEVYIIAVPTPFIKQKNNKIPKPNIKYVIDAIKSIIYLLKPNDLIIIESTCPVETTLEISKIISENINFDIQEINIAYCPERVIPGNIIYELKNNDRVIGGINENAAIAAKDFYSTFCKGNIKLTNSVTAEMVKLTENAFRDVNIAFANELSIICDELKIKVNELIKLANYHPRVNILNPGCGVGGHCIAVDPWFIASKFPEQTDLIQTARNVNTYKINWVSNKILEYSLNQEILLKRKPIIGILGITYKPNVDDLRESPALRIVMNLLDNDQELIISDPYINYYEVFKIYSIKELLNKVDFVVALVSHDEFKSLEIKEIPVLDFAGMYESNISF